jgi:hypothetical protein
LKAAAIEENDPNDPILILINAVSNATTEKEQGLLCIRGVCLSHIFAARARTKLSSRLTDMADKLRQTALQQEYDWKVLDSEHIRRDVPRYRIAVLQSMNNIYEYMNYEYYCAGASYLYLQLNFVCRMRKICAYSV